MSLMVKGIYLAASLCAVQICTASASTPGVLEALNAGESVMIRLQKGDLETLANQALSHLVDEGISDLREAREFVTADRFESEWNLRFRGKITEALRSPVTFEDSWSGFTDLGDHPPLLSWLARFQEQLSDKTRGITRQIRMLQDLNTLNYALPIVFTPRGSWHSGELKADSIEYRKHFIPFANIVTYWASYKGCELALDRILPKFKIVKYVCGPVADKLEWAMGRHIAPGISDWIYGVANHTAMRSRYLDSQLGLPTADELESTITHRSELNFNGELQ